MKRLFIGIILVALLAGICLNLYFNIQKKKGPNVEKLIARYSKGFVTKTIKVDDSLIAFSFDNPGWQNTDEPNYNSPPIAYLLDNGSISQVYEIDFKATVITQNERFIRHDVDEDGRDEIISEWIAYTPSPGGTKGMVIWKLENNKLVPLAGYPQAENEEPSLTVKNLETGETLTFPEIHWDCYTDYQTNELHLACYVWNFDAGESRNSPHIWKLRVFKFENGRFVKDKSWNNGEDLLTREKISVDESGYQKIREIFSSF